MIAGSLRTVELVNTERKLFTIANRSSFSSGGVPHEAQETRDTYVLPIVLAYIQPRRENKALTDIFSTNFFVSSVLLNVTVDQNFMISIYQKEQRFI